MLKKLTATTCALALFLPVSMPCYADEFDEALMNAARDALPVRTGAQQGVLNTASSSSQDTTYLENQMGKRLESMRDELNTRMTPEMARRNEQIRTLYANSYETTLTEEFLYVQAEADLLRRLHAHRFHGVFAGAKGLMEDFWINVTQLFHQQEENQRQRGILLSDWETGTVEHTENAANTFETLLNIINEELDSLGRRIQSAHENLMNSIDALLRGRNLPDSQHLDHMIVTPEPTTDSTRQIGAVGWIATSFTSLAARFAASADRKVQRFASGQPLFPAPTSTDQTQQNRYPEEPVQELIWRIQQNMNVRSIPETYRPAPIDPIQYVNNPMPRPASTITTVENEEPTEADTRSELGDGDKNGFQTDSEGEDAGDQTRSNRATSDATDANIEPQDTLPDPSQRQVVDSTDPQSVFFDDSEQENHAQTSVLTVTPALPEPDTKIPVSADKNEQIEEESPPTTITEQHLTIDTAIITPEETSEGQTVKMQPSPNDSSVSEKNETDEIDPSFKLEGKKKKKNKKSKLIPPLDLSQVTK